MQAAARGLVGEVFVFNWSENVLLLGGPGGGEQLDVEEEVISLVTMALSNDPVAEEMCPVGAWAEMSLVAVPPTVPGLGPDPLAGRYGFSGTALHGTSCHWVFGYLASKHPFFGRGACDRDSRQAFCFAASALSAALIAPVEPKLNISNARNAHDFSPALVARPAALCPNDLLLCCSRHHGARETIGGGGGLLAPAFPQNMSRARMN
jgi:hypothetical protein